jgi:hypothetical protein
MRVNILYSFLSKFLKSEVKGIFFNVLRHLIRLFTLMGDFTLILFLVVGLRTLTLKGEGLQFTLSMVNPFVNLFQPLLLFLLFLFLEAFDQRLSFFCLLLIKFFPCNAIIKFSRW